MAFEQGIETESLDKKAVSDLLKDAAGDVKEVLRLDKIYLSLASVNIKPC